jgi:hypothetical protein
VQQHKAEGIRVVVGIQDDDRLDPLDLEARPAEQRLEAAWQVIVGEVALPGRRHTRAEVRIVGRARSAFQSVSMSARRPPGRSTR